MAIADLDKNTSAALSYVLGPITGLAFFIFDTDPFVRFHALQSIFTIGGLLLFIWILGATAFLAPLIPLITILLFVLYLALIYTAWSGQAWQVPIIGEFVAKTLRRSR